MVNDPLQKAIEDLALKGYTSEEIAEMIQSMNGIEGGGKVVTTLETLPTFGLPKEEEKVIPIESSGASSLDMPQTVNNMLADHKTNESLKKDIEARAREIGRFDLEKRESRS